MSARAKLWVFDHLAAFAFGCLLGLLVWTVLG
jgi:hypothetical protein